MWSSDRAAGVEHVANRAEAVGQRPGDLAGGVVVGQDLVDRRAVQ